MQRYRSHKVVEAAKIIGVAHTDSGVEMRLDDGERAYVDIAWVFKHAPGQIPNSLIGGYLVCYPPDRYRSWSPADVFADGYTAIVDAAE